MTRARTIMRLAAILLGLVVTATACDLAALANDRPVVRWGTRCAAQGDLARFADGRGAICGRYNGKLRWIVAPRPAPAPPADAAPGPAPAPAPAASTTVQQVLERINQQRAANGVAPLAYNDQLTIAAQNHAGDMAARSTMSHTGSDGSTPMARITAAGYPARVSGEIVAYGQPTAAQVVDAWMASATHRGIILDGRLTEAGVGLSVNNGTPYWAVSFGAR